LPEVIAVKEKLVPQSDRYRMLARSALDLSWMEAIPADGAPAVILAEGLFMYLPEDQVRGLVLALQKRFPETELVCELTNRTWVEGLWGKLAQMKMQNRLKMQAQSAFQFGVEAPESLASWGPGIEFREMWFYMDENHSKLGWYRVFRGMKLIRMAQFTVRYTLHAV
jgi:O-methyltransferase involved in polyketide biosynthesis